MTLIYFINDFIGCITISCLHIVLGKNSLAVPEVPEKESGLISQTEAVLEAEIEEHKN